MNNISNLNKDDLPSATKLIRATVAAAAVSIVLLITTVLPAEYGIDPTGLGKAMGLNALHQAHAPQIQTAQAAQPQTSEPANLLSDIDAPLTKARTAPRTDKMSITLLPGKGAEIKSLMDTGDSFIFNWNAEGGFVYFDMHGEAPNAGNDEFSSYWTGQNQTQASGNFTAPFKGTHGWYWQNTGNTPVTITLTTHGFYGDLYMP